MFKTISQTIWRNIFVLFAVLLVAIMMFLSQDYGPLEDTQIHQEHGVRILNYFKGIDKIATLSPVNDKGDYIDVALSQDHENRGLCHLMIRSLDLFRFLHNPKELRTQIYG